MRFRQSGVGGSIVTADTLRGRGGRVRRAAGLRRHGAGGAPLLGRCRPHDARARDHGRRSVERLRDALQPIHQRLVPGARRRGRGNPAIPNAQAGRADRRRSLAYVGQLTDFQLADEESPARVEFTDQEPTGFAASAWRPQEALQPFIIDWSIRQMNLFSGASPVAQSGGDRAAMDFTLITGDQADNMQRNEMLWARGLLEGGTSLDPNSGSQNPLDWSPLMHPSCAAYPPNAANLAEAAKYTGVQDYDDYDEGPTPYFYDPDNPQGYWAGLARPIPGLMDRAQLPFTPAGLNVPSYVTNGNHDGLVQGNQDGNAAFEDIATGCFKALGITSTPLPGQPPDGLDPSRPADAPRRRCWFRPTRCGGSWTSGRPRRSTRPTAQDDAHGYDFVDEDEDANSAGGASYYAWDPPEAPGLRFISIDTLSEGGIVEQSSNGNIDDPQFQWLESELEFAQGPTSSSSCSGTTRSGR